MSLISFAEIVKEVESEYDSKISNGETIDGSSLEIDVVDKEAMNLVIASFKEIADACEHNFSKSSILLLNSVRLIGDSVEVGDSSELEAIHIVMDISYSTQTI